MTKSLSCQQFVKHELQSTKWGLRMASEFLICFVSQELSDSHRLGEELSINAELRAWRFLPEQTQELCPIHPYHGGNLPAQGQSRHLRPAALGQQSDVES
jgi:hypothetical protein